jgi:hypothetical protein
MQVNVSMDGEKLFDWEGGTAEIAKLDADLTQQCAEIGMTPQQIAQAAILDVKRNGGFRPAEAGRGEMMYITWLLMNMQSTNEERPGLIRDYIDVWNFDFNIECQDKRFHIDVKATLGDVEGTA